MTTRYIHIGYPKNLSTSLQRDYFGKHPDLLHLGVGCHDHNLGYIDDDISLAIEFYFRTAKNFLYEEKKEHIVNCFQQYFQKAEEDDAVKAVGISSEHMSFNFTVDNIDVTEKAKRLHEIFGSDTKIVMLVRNQMKLIRSFYHECVRVGYPKKYEDYMTYMYMFHERNYVSDFFFGDAYELYADLFGQNNICVIPMESIRENGELIKDDQGKVVVLREVSDHLNVSYPKQELGHYNQALDQAVIVKTQELNAQNPHDLGNTLYGTAESHRIIKRFENELKITPPHEAREDVATKRRVIGEAMELAKQDPELKVDYTCSSDIIMRLEDLFRRSNKKLMQKTGIDFEALGYSL